MRISRWAWFAGAFITLITGSLSPAFGATSVQPHLDQRVQGAERRFAELMRMGPLEPVRALISFRTGISPKDAVLWTKMDRLHLTGMFYAFITPTRTMRGGYFLDPSKPVDEELGNFTQGYYRALMGHIRALERSLNNRPTLEKTTVRVPDTFQEEEVRAAIRDLYLELESARENGVSIFGVEVSGTPVGLQRFRSRRPGRVRLIELLSNGQPAVPLLPND